jgi:hypothetical protein
VEPNEIMTLWIDDEAQNATVVGQRWAVGTIYNDDVEVTLVGGGDLEDTGFIQPKYWVSGAGTALAHAGFEIELVGSTSDGSAEAPDDYQAVTGHAIEVNSGATQQNPFVLAHVEIEDDGLEEDPETIIYSVSVGEGTTDGLDVHIITYTCILGILDDD